MIATLPEPLLSVTINEEIGVHDALEAILKVVHDEAKGELANIAAIQERADNHEDNSSDNGDINKLFDELINKIIQSRRIRGE